MSGSHWNGTSLLNRPLASGVLAASRLELSGVVVRVVEIGCAHHTSALIEPLLQRSLDSVGIQYGSTPSCDLKKSRLKLGSRSLDAIELSSGLTRRRSSDLLGASHTPAVRHFWRVVERVSQGLDRAIAKGNRSADVFYDRLEMEVG